MGLNRFRVKNSIYGKNGKALMRFILKIAEITHAIIVIRKVCFLTKINMSNCENHIHTITEIERGYCYERNYYLIYQKKIFKIYFTP